MRATAEQYRETLLALLPVGSAWQRDTATTLGQLLGALATPFATAHNRAADLIEEADPRTTLELLADWERVAGLPDDCYGALTTIPARREALLAHLTTLGGQSIAYYAALCAALGRDVTIVEDSPFDVTMDVDTPISGTDAWFTWAIQVHGYSSLAFYFDVRDSGVDEPLASYEIFDIVRFDVAESGVDEPLAYWGDRLLECLITRLKPAHTAVRFEYVE